MREKFQIYKIPKISIWVGYLSNDQNQISKLRKLN